MGKLKRKAYEELLEPLQADLADMARWVSVTGQRLVVDGWYRFVRNPMYVAVVSIILGQALLFASWAALVYGIVVFVVVHLFVTGYEEPTLTAQFPADYAAYRANVPRWLPRFRATAVCLKRRT